MPSDYSIIAWLIGLACAVCATILSAASGDATMQMATTAMVCLAFAALAIRDRQALQRNSAPETAVGSSTARYLGFVWAWGALALVAIYMLILERHWPEWWQFFAGFAFAAAGSAAFSLMLQRDAATGKSDPTINKIGRILLQAQLIGMVVGIVSLFVDGKFPRSTVHPDWAGCNIFFFGALAIITICFDALRSARAHDA